jgi:hypothetical protein
VLEELLTEENVGMNEFLDTALSANVDKYTTLIKNVYIYIQGVS